jgi:hypothetical protein
MLNICTFRNSSTFCSQHPQTEPNLYPSFKVRSCVKPYRKSNLKYPRNNFHYQATEFCYPASGLGTTQTPMFIHPNVYLHSFIHQSSASCKNRILIRLLCKNLSLCFNNKHRPSSQMFINKFPDTSSHLCSRKNVGFIFKDCALVPNNSKKCTLMKYAYFASVLFATLHTYLALMPDCYV